MLAAGFEVEFVHAPVLQVVAERQHAHFVHQMEFSGTVEVKDGREGFRMTIEEVFILYEGVVVADFSQGFVCVAVSKTTKSET